MQDRFEPSLSRAGTVRELEAMRDLVAEHPGLRWQEQNSEKFGGARLDTFRYQQQFEMPGLPSTVRTEPGVAGGDHPASQLEIESKVASFLRDQGQEDMAEDTSAFGVTILHFRRTFVEKLFVVHALVERLKEDGEPLGRDARHYYDLHALAPRPEVKEMLASDECEDIKRDCRKIGLKFFRKKYKAPPDLSFAGSDGVFPPADLRDQIERDYAAECGRLCFGEIPTFDQVIGRLEELRPLL